jgi:hypothetical protein
MTRRATISTLALLAVVACGRKGARSSDFDRATAAALASGTTGTAAPGQPKVAKITGFEFAHQLDRRNRVVGGTADHFSPSDSILLSVGTIHAAADAEVSARLRLNNRTVDSIGTTAGAPDSSGVSVVGVRFGPIKGGGKGLYQADVFLGGKFQMAKEFNVDH